MRSPGTAKVNSPVVSNMVKDFRQWLEVKGHVAIGQQRQKELRETLLTYVRTHGEVDEHGSVFLELPESISFTEPTLDLSKGARTFVYTVLKMERHLTPAQPVPDPDKATRLLKRKKLWLSKEDEKIIQEIQLRNPYVSITVDVDPDALTQAYFKEAISEEDYDACLGEQAESYQFRPLEK